MYLLYMENQMHTKRGSSCCGCKHPGLKGMLLLGGLLFDVLGEGFWTWKPQRIQSFTRTKNKKNKLMTPELCPSWKKICCLKEGLHEQIWSSWQVFQHTFIRVFIHYEDKHLISKFEMFKTLWVEFEMKN